ncbi:MAG: hypothetical protein ABFD76_15365 [Smithella sp.]
MSLYEDELKDKKLQKILKRIDDYIFAKTAKMKNKIQKQLWKMGK